MFDNDDLFQYCLKLFQNELEKLIVKLHKTWQGIPDSSYFHFSEFVFRVKIYKVVNDYKFELEDKEKEIRKIITSYVSIVGDNYEQELIEELF